METANNDNLQQLFSEYLKSKKLRETEERMRILEWICSTKSLFTIDIILEKLQENKFHVSRASIYNTIELLLDAKIIVRHLFSTTNTMYELRSIADRHNHVICLQCGSVQTIRNDNVKKFLAGYKIPKFTHEYNTLYFYGLCSKCKYRLMREEIKARKLSRLNNSTNKQLNK